MRCKQTDGEVRGQGSGLRRSCWKTAAVESPFQMPFSRRWYRACLQAVCDQAPTSLHLSDCIRGAWALRCPIHKRAEPSRQPTQMLHTLTWGHPPTLCCVNDSPPHIMVKTASRLCLRDQWRLWSERKSPFKTFHQRSGDTPNNTQRVRGGGLIDSHYQINPWLLSWGYCWAWKRSNVNASITTDTHERMFKKKHSHI